MLPAAQALAADINIDSTCSLANAIRSANGDAQVAPMNSCETGTAGSGTAGADRILLSGSVTLTTTTVLPRITSHVTITSDDNSVQRNIQFSYLETTADSHLTIERVNLLNGGNRSAGKAALNLGGPATLRHVLISGSQLTGIRGRGENATYDFSELVIWDTATEWNWPNAIWAQAGAYTITDLVAANMFAGLALFRIDEGASITLKGCKAIFNTAAYRIWGSRSGFRDNSASVCTSPTADYGYTVPARARPAALPCGFPDARFINVRDNAGTLTYTLTSDCTLTRQLVVPDNARVVIRSAPGQRFTITMASNNYRFLNVSGRITLRNVDVVAPTHASQLLAFIRIMPSGVLVMEDSTLRADSAGGFLMAIRNDAGDIHFNQVTLQGFKSSQAVFASGIMNVGAGRIIIRDSTIQDNTGGAGAISLFHNAGYLYLVGTNTFTGNTRQAGACATGYDPRGICDAHSLICEGEGCLPSPPAPERAKEEAPSPGSGVSTCVTLPANIQVSGITQSTQCQLVSGYAIGNEEIAAAAINAVDVWGRVLPNTQICFDAGGGGSFRFLDAATSPRAVSELPAYNLNGLTCATIDRAGTVVLLPGPPVPPGGSPSTASRSLSDCMVRTKYMLNFRDGPAGEVIDILPWNVTLTAPERTSDWFKVDYHGARGWISADYVEPIGNCGQAA